MWGGVPTKGPLNPQSKVIFGRFVNFLQQMPKMAPSTGQWLQVRVWDAPTKGLVWQSFLREGRVVGPCWEKLKPKGPKGPEAGHWMVPKMNLKFRFHSFGSQFRGLNFRVPKIQVTVSPHSFLRFFAMVTVPRRAPGEFLYLADQSGRSI